MVDLVRACRSIAHIDREDKALQRCNPSARSMPGDGQEHRPRLVLLPSHSSSGSKAKNLLNWGEAPTQVDANDYPSAVGHMSTLVGRCAFQSGLCKPLERRHLQELWLCQRLPCLRFDTTR